MKDLLSSLFPANDFSLIAVVMALPLLGAFVNGVFGRRLGKDAVRLMTLAVTGASFAAAIATFIALDGAAPRPRPSRWSPSLAAPPRTR
jgi:NADH-quinone oxidoreductase subunit L